MVLWTYFDIGERIKIPFSRAFQSRAILKKSLSKTQQFEKSNTNKKVKKDLTGNSIIYSTAISLVAVKYFMTKSLVKTTLSRASITSLERLLKYYQKIKLKRHLLQE